ncbi:hypothetical protein D3C80_1224130 [compost metagenome]
MILLRQMEWMKERVPPVQRSRAPGINQLLPCCADSLIFEFPVIEQVKSKQLIRAQREFRHTILIQTVSQIRISRITEIGSKVLLQLVSHTAPLLRFLLILHIIGKINTRPQLAVPQRLNIIGPGITRGI